MIKVTINRSKNGLIQSFAITGHANFKNRGEDIVCAGVSAVSFGTVNAIIALTKADLRIEQGDGGFLRCELPEQVDEAIQERIQLLLEGMIISLQTIENDYGKFIKIINH